MNVAGQNVIRNFATIGDAESFQVCLAISRFLFSSFLQAAKNSLLAKIRFAESTVRLRAELVFYRATRALART